MNFNVYSSLFMQAVYELTMLNESPKNVLPSALKLARKLLLLLMFTMLIFPSVLQEVKLAILLTIFSLVIFCIKFNKYAFRLHSDFIIITLFIVCAGLFGSLNGVMNNAPGAISMLSVFFVYPLMGVFLIPLFRKSDYVTLRSFFYNATISLIVIDVFFLLSFYHIDGGLVYSIFIHLYDEKAVVDNGGGNYLLFTLPNVASMIFLLPFMLVEFMVKKNVKTAFILLVSICLMAITGRRAIFVIVMVGIIIGFIYLNHIVKQGRRKIIKAAFLILPLAVLISFFILRGVNFNFEMLDEQLTSIMNFSSDDSNLERKYQFDALWQGIINHPFIGNGAGAVASYIRSETQPWTYELFYIALVFQYGIPIFLLYLFGVIYLIYYLLKLIKDKSLDVQFRSFTLCLTSGLICFLIANATNPYLAKFDFMLVIFLPAAIVNYYKLNRDVLC